MSDDGRASLGPHKLPLNGPDVTSLDSKLQGNPFFYVLLPKNVSLLFLLTFKILLPVLKPSK